jgi:hypothetical protein
MKCIPNIFRVLKVKLYPSPGRSRPLKAWQVGIELIPPKIPGRGIVSSRDRLIVRARRSPEHSMT